MDICIGRCPDKSESTGAPAGVAIKQSTEDKLKELKRLHDTGLIGDDVYLERQRAILGRP